MDDPYFVVNKNQAQFVTSVLKVANSYVVSGFKNLSEILHVSKCSVMIPFSVKIMIGALPTSCSVIISRPITKVGSSYGSYN